MAYDISSARDLEHLMDTSSRWFDNSIETIYQSEDIVEDTVHRTYIFLRFHSDENVVSVFKRDVIPHNVKKTATGGSSFSATYEDTLIDSFMFEDFKKSKWYEKTLEACKSGEKADTSGLGASYTMEEGYIGFRGKSETYYKDWLGNTRVGRGFKTYEVSLMDDSDPSIYIELDDRHIERSIEDILDCVSIVDKLRSAGYSFDMDSKDKIVMILDVKED